MGDPASGRQLGGSGCVSSWTPGSGLTWGLAGMLDNRRMARWPGETPTPGRGPVDRRSTQVGLEFKYSGGTEGTKLGQLEFPLGRRTLKSSTAESSKQARNCERHGNRKRVHAEKQNHTRARRPDGERQGRRRREGGQRGRPAPRQDLLFLVTALLPAAVGVFGSTKEREGSQDPALLCEMLTVFNINPIHFTNNFLNASPAPP